MVAKGEPQKDDQVRDAFFQMRLSARGRARLFEIARREGISAADLLQRLLDRYGLALHPDLYPTVGHEK